MLVPYVVPTLFLKVAMTRPSSVLIRSFRCAGVGSFSDAARRRVLDHDLKKSGVGGWVSTGAGVGRLEGGEAQRMPRGPGVGVSEVDRGGWDPRLR
jgi:hypothetical protein